MEFLFIGIVALSLGFVLGCIWLYCGIIKLLGGD